MGAVIDFCMQSGLKGCYVRSLCVDQHVLRVLGELIYGCGFINVG